MGNIELRIANLSDAPRLLDIYTYYVENTAISFELTVPSIEDFTNRISNTLQKYPYIVASIDNNIVAYAYLSPFRTRLAYKYDAETSIYVDKDYKRRGIGRALYTKLEECAKKMNILNINAATSIPETEDKYLTMDSYNFHKKMGYSYVGTFHKCGYKFGRWYSLAWFEKLIGEHTEKNLPLLLPCNVDL